jgi:biotin carboxyl carrier protein
MAVTAPMPGSVWKIKVEEGQTVKAGDELLIMESMKMEIPVLAEADGTVAAMFCQPGDPVKADQILAAVSTARP